MLQVYVLYMCYMVGVVDVPWVKYWQIQSIHQVTISFLSCLTNVCKLVFFGEGDVLYQHQAVCSTTLLCCCIAIT